MNRIGRDMYEKGDIDRIDSVGKRVTPVRQEVSPSAPPPGAKVFIWNEETGEVE